MNKITSPFKSALRVALLLCFTLSSFQFSYAQNPGQWMWIHGDSTSGSAGSFGVQGVPSPSNNPPGIYEPCEWIDLQGNFWMYGGDGAGGLRDELWKYDTLSNEWTWISGLNVANDAGSYGIQGIASSSNHPPSKGYGFASWVDASGDLWMFGGISGGAFSVYDDLWRYNIATNQWTWMKGPQTGNDPGVYGTQGIANIANYPGSRREACDAWTDSAGDLWLFGGSTGNYDLYNDLWRYNVASNTWTWMKGSQSTNQSGVYGNLGVENSANTPGGRMSYCRWKDKHGNLWLFGGGDFMTSNHYNDMWRYNPVTNNWAWMNGSTAFNSTGDSGTKCVTDTANEPLARFEDRAAWTDANGNLWMLGGATGDGSLPYVYNDLWMYCVSSNEWTWESGMGYSNPAGLWGTMNVSTPYNVLMGRGGAPSWRDKSSHLYLFGGWGTGFGFYNDLWKFTIDPACGAACSIPPHALFTSSDTTICSESGKCISFYDHSTGNPTSWQWVFFGAIPDSSIQQNPTNICYYTPGTYPVILIVSNASGTDTINVYPMITLASPPPPPTITVVGGDTLTCSAAAGYQWYFNGSAITGANNQTYVATQSGTYAVAITDATGGCSVISPGVILNVSVNEISWQPAINIYPNPATDQLTIGGFPLSTGYATLEIFNVLGEKTLAMQLKGTQKQVINIKQFAAGLYFLRISNQAVSFVTKFAKE